MENLFCKDSSESENYLRNSLVDNHCRKINYLRLAVTDRCNLRCNYCMPKNGVKNICCSDILRYEEMEKLVKIFAELGIEKVRITGGEPFVRKGLINFLFNLKKINGIESLFITTNGTLIRPYLSSLKKLGVNGLNLSLDTLRREKYKQITSKDCFETVMESIDEILKLQIPLKINTVIDENCNLNEVCDFVEFVKDKNITVRFIEQMSFNGNNLKIDKFATHNKILRLISDKYKFSETEKPVHSTSSLFKIDGFKGKFGIIAGNSRLFCDKCNKLRITPTGILKNCLYEKSNKNLKELIRNNKNDDYLKEIILNSVNKKKINGFEAEVENEKSVYSSMSLIGG